MFTDKQLQNPFLKPSPFTSTSAHPTSSYSSSTNYPPRNQSYKPYQQPKNTYRQSTKSYQNYDSYKPQTSSKNFQSKDISAILSNNPFNRSFQPSFAVEKAARDLSPNSRPSNRYSNEIGNQYDTYTSNVGYQISRASNSNNNRKSQTPSRIAPVRNNYLSNSSADSATTYINKIYDIEEDRVSVNQTKSISNPFLRKNLLPYNHTERQTSNNNYDPFPPSSALKYENYDYEQKRSKSPAFGQQYYGGQDYSRPSQNYGNFNRGLTFSQQYDNYAKKYQRPSQNNYAFIDQQVRATSAFANDLVSKDKNYDSYKYEYKPSREYDQEYQEPQFGTRDARDNYPFKFQSLNYQDPQSRYSKDNKKSWKMQRQEKQSYSIKPPYEESSYKPIKKEEERVKFTQGSQSSKYQSYKGYQDNYDRNSRQYEFQKKQDIGTSFGGYSRPLNNKLASSNVDEYTTPEDIEKKIKENKYQKLGIQNPSNRSKPKSATNIVPFDDNEQQEERQPPKLNKAPTRDSAEEFPRILELNGVLFHKIEVM